jgi:hypothetical protein
VSTHAVKRTGAALLVALGLPIWPGCAPRAPGAAGPSTAGVCKDGTVPTGKDGACMKTCVEDSDCAHGEQCMSTQFDMGGGEMAHVRVCG